MCCACIWPTSQLSPRLLLLLLLKRIDYNAAVALTPGGTLHSQIGASSRQCGELSQLSGRQSSHDTEMSRVLVERLTDTPYKTSCSALVFFSAVCRSFRMSVSRNIRLRGFGITGGHYSRTATERLE